jgi:chromosome segregation ATPase
LEAICVNPSRPQALSFRSESHTKTPPRRILAKQSAAAAAIHLITPSGSSYKMAPYDYHQYPSSFSQYPSSNEYQYQTPNSYHYEYNPPLRSRSSGEYSNRDAIISSLMEKLADREAEIRRLGSENAELKNELRHQEQLRQEDAGKIVELPERLQEREQELNAVAREKDDLHSHQRGLEMSCSKLERALDAREKDLSAMENEMEAIHYELERASELNEAKSQDICALENKLEDLEREIEHYKGQLKEAVSVKNHLHDREAELKAILKDNEVILEQQEKEIKHLSRKTRGLEYDSDAQTSMLEEQEQDIANMKRVIARLNNVINSQDAALEKKEGVILQLSMDIERYEQVIQEAEHTTWGQRRQIKDEMQQREKMMTEIEQLKTELSHERSGLMSIWGKGCGAKP